MFHKEFAVDNIIDLDGEIWKDIDGTQGRYKVSNKGRIKSLSDYETRILK